MTWLRILITRFIALFRKGRLERELDEELRAHLEMLIEENLRKGMSPEEARSAALRSFGGVEQVKECYRDQRGLRVVETLIQDIRYGLRQLRRSPGFTVVAVVTLALGIGVNTAIFSVVNPVLIHGLPYPHADRLVLLAQANKDNGPGLDDWWYVAPPQFLAWKKDSDVFEDVAAVMGLDVTLTGAGEPARLRAKRVTANFLPLLGVQPALGRSFAEHEEHVAILTHGLWERRFSSDPNLIGRALTFDNEVCTVIGVLPPEFRYFPGIEVFLPNPLKTVSPSSSIFILYVIARLKPGTTVAQAETEATAIASRLGLDYWVREKDQRWHIGAIPLSKELARDVRPDLLVLACAVGFVLLIGCLTVASLLLARAASRQREMAVRTAVGASRPRLIRQTFTESVLLSSLGGASGLAVAYWGIKALALARPDRFYENDFSPQIAIPLERIHLDWQVLVFTLGLSMLAGLVFGLAPAIFASQTNVNECLKEWGASVTAGRGHGRVLSLLVIGELAVSLVLLAGAGLMIRSLIRTLGESPGFDVDKVLELVVPLPSKKYSVEAGVSEEPSHEKLVMLTPEVDLFTEGLTQRLKAIPGVESVARRSGGWGGGKFRIEGEAEGREHEPLVRWVSPDFFRAMGMPLLKGRVFSKQDTETAPPVAIISERLARDFWPGEQLIGRRLVGQDWDGKPLGRPIEIVGIVRSPRERAADPIGSWQYLYFPCTRWTHYPYYSQRKDGKLSVWPAQALLYVQLVVRTSSDPTAFVARVQKAVWDMDKLQPITEIKPMEDDFWSSLDQRRFYMHLLIVFAGLALLLAMVGLYGVMSYSVARRTHEIGVRRALGATPRDVVWLTVRYGLVLSLIAVPIGIVAALGLTRFLASFLYGIKPTDPVTLAGVSGLLIIVALLACYIPARRATKVDPLVALRYE